MLEIFEGTDISFHGWVAAMIGSFLLGAAKGGLKGFGAIITTMFALVYGSKVSTGIVMPLLIVGDIFAVMYYHRHAQWSYLWKLMPWMLIGVLVGVWYGKELPEDAFKRGMAILIFISVVLMWALDRIKRYQVPDNRLFAAIMGGISGFATMVGNLAGPFSELYFLAIRMPKQMFIGTTAWLFFITNMFKLPFHIWSWETINLHSIKIDLVLLPALFLGLWAGISLVKIIKQNQFRLIIMGLTALGALFIFFRN
ncbi:MAG TPA: sulfite exporter TauE/SafE family protein [Saprospiraceae bacterium]